MDATTNRLVDYAMGTEYSQLPEATVHEVKRRLIDTFACAVGAYDDPLCKMARLIANRYSGATAEATVWGSNWRTTADAAAFANGVMLRMLDMSDMYRVKSGGHPSDTIAAIWAAAEMAHSDGPTVINAITLAYDIYCGFCDAVDVNVKGWDQPVYSVIASALGAGKVLGLSKEQMGNALSLALAPNMAMVQSRRGELSAWKGCAGANASRNALFAVILSQQGFTGPTAVFEGKGGLWDIVGEFSWNISAEEFTPHRVSSTHLKSFPVCYHAQSAAQAAIESRRGLRAEDIIDVNIETYRHAFLMLGNDPTRWAPSTRETADHSMPYVVAVALLDGEVTAQSFAEQRLTDPEVVRLMRTVSIAENSDFTAQYPQTSFCKMSVRTSNGKEIVTEVKYPKGHVHNAMDDKEVEEKFRVLFRDFGNKEQCERALEQLWRFDRSIDIGDVSRLFAVNV